MSSDDRGRMSTARASVLDRLITWFSPERGARRRLARLRLAATQQAYYDGATIGRRGASIRRSAADANVVSRRTLGKLRTGSRDLIRNNPHARRAVDAIVGNTVGAGIAPQFIRQDQRAEDLEELANRFLETNECDAEGRYTYHGLQAVALQAMVEGGEVLVRRRRRRAADGLAVPLQFQLLEGDYLDDSKDGRTSTGGQIIQGVEFDAIGRRRGYWLFDEHPGSDRLSVTSRFVPARDIAHVYRQDRPGQVRGIPWLAPVMLRLADAADYEDAQLMRQKIAACFVGAIYEPFDANVTIPTATGSESAGELARDASGNIVEHFEPGMWARLPVGTDVKFGTPPAVEGYEEYMRVVLRSIAAGAGLSYEALTSDLTGVNFTSGRMGHLEFQRNIDRWRQLTFIPQFSTPLMTWFLEGAMLMGIDADGVTVRHVAPRREMIDPNREIAAEIEAVRSGQKTLTQVLRQSGRDSVEHLREWAADATLLDELGLILDSDPRQDHRGTEGAGDGGDVRAAIDRYGLAVRAGAVTPQVEDEERLRELAELPPMSEAARRAWGRELVRRPITLTKPGEGVLDDDGDDPPPPQRNGGRRRAGRRT